MLTLTTHIDRSNFRFCYLFFLSMNVYLWPSFIHRFKINFNFVCTWALQQAHIMLAIAHTHIWIWTRAFSPRISATNQRNNCMEAYQLCFVDGTRAQCIHLKRIWHCKQQRKQNHDHQSPASADSQCHFSHTKRNIRFSGWFALRCGANRLNRQASLFVFLFFAIQAFFK